MCEDVEWISVIRDPVAAGYDYSKWPRGSHKDGEDIDNLSSYEGLQTLLHYVVMYKYVWRFTE
jgi:hypothetical protein